MPGRPRDRRERGFGVTHVLDQGPRSRFQRQPRARVSTPWAWRSASIWSAASAPSARLSIQAAGRDADQISTGEDNLIWQTALAVAADTGGQLPPIELIIDNQIPIGKGLGSSAAALTAGVVIADQSARAGLEPAAHSG